MVSDPSSHTAPPPTDTTTNKGGHHPCEDTEQEEPHDNEWVVVTLAIHMMQNKGWIDEPDDELFATLQRLYHEHPVCQVEVKFTGEVLHDMLAMRPGEFLLAAYEAEYQARWEREQAERWSCPCGITFGLYVWSDTHVAFYTLTDTGQFDRQAVTCPCCSRNLAKARAESANGQLGFAF
jgi:hypothetical protein